MDWKILAASLVALVVVSGIFVGSMGDDNVLTDIFNRISEWLQNSPLQGFLSTPQAENKKVLITFISPDFDIPVDNIINITAGGTLINEFKGTIDPDFSSGLVTFRERDSSLGIVVVIDNILIEGVETKKLLAEELNFKTDDNIDAQNGSVEITNFLGSVQLSGNDLRFEGNASKFMIRVGDSAWEMV